MKQFSVYLTFPGTCREALSFYKDSLNGDILSMQTFGESPMETPESEKDRILHSEFKADNIFFMASDSMPEQCVNSGSNITLSINLTDAEEQVRIFRNLSEGGQVTFPLQDTFWGAHFGMLTDKFGINWMLNRQLSEN